LVLANSHQTEPLDFNCLASRRVRSIRRFNKSVGLGALKEPAGRKASGALPIWTSGRRLPHHKSSMGMARFGCRIFGRVFRMQRREVDMTLVLSNEEVVKLLPMEAAIEALEPSYCDLSRGEAICPPRRDLLVPLAGPVKTVYEFKSMPAVYPRKKIAVWRVNSDFLTWHNRAGTVRREKDPRAPGNRFVGLVFLFSMETGELVAIFPDGEMQRIRVGASNGIAAKHLAREDSSTLALLGSGFQAGAQLLAMCAVRPIRHVRVFSPNAEHRNAFIDEWRGKVSASLEAVSSGREACDGADRQVDLGGADDERHRHGHHRDDGRLAEDVEEVRGGQEAGAG